VYWLILITYVEGPVTALSASEFARQHPNQPIYAEHVVNERGDVVLFVDKATCEAVAKGIVDHLLKNPRIGVTPYDTDCMVADKSLLKKSK
jgi:hypothetical protein